MLGSRDWSNNVDLTPADVLKDIGNCNLLVVELGDSHLAQIRIMYVPTTEEVHPGWPTIVNAIGNSTACDGNTGYWKNTAIYDHVGRLGRLLRSRAA